MSFNHNKIIFTQKRSTIFILLFVTLFLLFCSSSSLALDSPATDQSQLHIKLLLTKGTPTCSLAKEDAAYFIEEDGLCFGLSAIWLYSKWLQFVHPEKVIAYNGDWYKSTVMDILGAWSDCGNIKKFAQFVKKLQNSYVWTFEKEMNQLDTEEKIQKEYSIASLLTLNQLQQLLKENIIHDHKLIFICSHNHAVALFKNGYDYYFFDPNSLTGECKVSSTDELAELIFNANRFDRMTPSPLALEVFSFDKQTQNYPSQQEILDLINPSLVSKRNYADERTGLDLAAQYGCVESTHYFLNKNSDLNSDDYYGFTGNTALMLAAQNGHLEVVQLLLANKAEINKAANSGSTAFMLAAQNGHLEVVQLLLASDADFSLVNKKGFTAAMIAMSNNHFEIADEIEKVIKVKEIQKTNEELHVEL